MSKYPWRWIQFPHRWWPHVRGGSLYAFGAGYEWRSAPRVPPDTARRRMRRRQMATLEALVEQAKRMGKAVR